MRIKLLALAMLLLSGMLAGCRSSGSTPFGSTTEDNSPIILEINGTPERQSAFDRFIKARLADFSSQEVQTPADYDQTRSQLLDRFILRQLIVREAQEKKIEPTDDEIRQAMETQHKLTSASNSAINSDSQERNLSALEGGDRRFEIYYDLVVLKFYEQEVKGDVKVTPEEIESYYSTNQDRYQGRNGFYVREIRVREQNEAVRLHRQALAKPRDFAVLAKEHSEAPTAENGGLIYYETQQLPQVMEQAIQSLKVGSISGVVKSSYGFHIFKLEQLAEPLPLEKVKKEIAEILLDDKNRLLIDKFNRRAIAGAKIEIYRDRLGFNYSGGLAGS
jgi:parvulin-like peptidyl-prolyl isomerase